MGKITGFHAHVYFDQKTIEEARGLCSLISEKFALEMGTVHEETVGPHPEWSCQLSFDQNKFARVVQWLAINRKGLVILIHPQTGDDLADHLDHAIWMGKILNLKLEMF